MMFLLCVNRCVRRCVMYLSRWRSLCLCWASLSRWEMDRKWCSCSGNCAASWETGRTSSKTLPLSCILSRHCCVDWWAAHVVFVIAVKLAGLPVDDIRVRPQVQPRCSVSTLVKKFTLRTDVHNSFFISSHNHGAQWKLEASKIISLVLTTSFQTLMSFNKVHKCLTN